jgi:CheY-like chemotaxis protein
MTPAPIVIVDDSPDDVILLRHLLRKAAVGNPIATASDGAAAQRLLQAALAHRGLMPGVVFSDMRMRPIDGLALVRWARSQRPFDRVQFVLLTGLFDRAQARAANAVGANGCFEKFPSANVLARYVGATSG